MQLRKRFTLELENGVLKKYKESPSSKALGDEMLSHLFLFGDVPKAAWKNPSMAVGPTGERNKWFQSVQTTTIQEGMELIVLVPCLLPDPGEKPDLVFLDQVNCWVCSVKLLADFLTITPLFPLAED